MKVYEYCLLIVSQFLKEHDCEDEFEKDGKFWREYKALQVDSDRSGIGINRRYQTEIKECFTIFL